MQCDPIEGRLMKHPWRTLRARLHRPSPWSVRAATLIASISIAVGCGDDEATEHHDAVKKTRSCEPGTIYSCISVGCEGRQACRHDGSGLLPCSCHAAEPAASGGTPGGRGRDAGSIQDAGGRDAANPNRRLDPSQDASGDLDAAPPERADAAASQDAGQGEEPISRAPKPPAAERCDNEEDDDGDGQPDCADEDCTTMRCIDAAPTGWQGPVAFGTSSAPITCSGTFDRLAFEAGAGPDAEPASCSTCTCQGGCDEFVDFKTSTAEQCGGVSCSTSVSSSCIEISPQCLQGVTTAYLKTALPGASSCTPSEQHPTLPDRRWNLHAGACLPGDVRRGGCGADQLCLPQAPGAGFEPTYCIWQEGDVACPAASYTQRRTYHREIVDTRGCSPCSCNAPECSYSWRVFNIDDATCTSPVLELSAVDQCAQVNPVMGKLRVGFTGTSDGACVAAGGETRGGVTASNPVTVCCAG